MLKAGADETGPEHLRIRKLCAVAVRRNTDGTTTHYVGCKAPVTSRKEEYIQYRQYERTLFSKQCLNVVCFYPIHCIHGRLTIMNINDWDCCVIKMERLTETET